MANLIKGALIKQLSKFLKNVSANQINISTFKGEGEMKNIQLDENVLMELLELPTWLSITSARCNKASLKIQWTKLKTIPIIIALDKIEVDMEISENLREFTTSKDSKFFDKDSTGPYGFIDRCIDGIQLNIDSITVTIKSQKFNANLIMSNLLVYSTTPNWKVTPDIRNTRLKDLIKEEIIVFKEISWEICRLEAFNIEPVNQSQQPPTSIKLIMNPSKIQIALKKKLSDKSLLNSTFRILLNEIYWMANDTQLKAAIGSYNTISKLIKKSSLQKRKHMAYQQQHQGVKQPDTAKTLNSPQQPLQQSNIESSKVFLQYDIKETSLHLNISVLNIHLYADDNYSGNKFIDGGAMQVLFKDLCIDHYPYHKTGQTIKHWNNYNHIFNQREDWSKQLMDEFVIKLQTILNKSNLNDINKIKLKNEINLLESCVIITLKDLCVYKVSTNMSNKSATLFRSKKFATNETKAEEDLSSSSNDLLKTADFFIHQQAFNKRPFFSTNFAEFNLPVDTLFAHFFFSEFYFPDDCNYPVPCSQIYSHISPVLINIDYLTLLWMNTLILSLWNEKLSVDKNKEISTQDDSKKKQTKLNLHCDTHLELLMPKITISIYSHSKDQTSDLKRQSGIEIGFARISVSNKTNISNDANLKSACSKVYPSSKELNSKQTKFSVFENKNEPHEDKLYKLNQTKLNNLSPCFNDMIKNENLSYFRYDLSFDDDLTKMINTTNEAQNSKLGLFLKSLNRNALNKNANKDIWCINYESMWLDTFRSNSAEMSSYNINSQFPSNNENTPLIQNITFKVWLINVHDFYKPFESGSNKSQTNGLQKESLNLALNKLSKIIKIDNFKREPRKKRSNSVSVTQSLIKNKQDSYYLCRQAYSKLNIISEINELSFKCNHSQIIFLLRLLDTVDLFGKQLKIDSEHILKYSKSSDKNNSTKKKTKEIDLYFSDQEDFNKVRDKNTQSDLNVSIIINTIDIELHLNDYRKVINSDFNQNQPSIPIKPADLNETIENDLMNFNIFIKDPMKEGLATEDFDFNKRIEKEIITGYLKYIYGFSTENPNQRLSFSSVNSLLDDTPNNDIVNLARQLQVNKLPSNINNAMSVGFSAASSTLIAKKNSTISFFNKPSFSNIKSNIKQQFHTQNQTDFIDNDLLVDDNDSYSSIIGLDQDDTSSLASFATDISYHQTNSNEKISPNEKSYDFIKQSISLSSSTSSIANINSKITPISSHVMTEPNHELNELKESISETSKAFNDYQCQTIQTTVLVRLKLKNVQTYAQVNDNSDTFALVKLEQLQLRNMKSTDKDNASDVLVRFKKIEQSSDCANGLVEVFIENFFFEIDIPTLTGLIDLIDDDDIGIEVKKEVMPANISIKNCEFSLNNQINETDQCLKDEKNVNVTIKSLLINRLANNQIVIAENSFKTVKEVSIQNLEVDKSNRLASLVFMLRKSKEDNFHLQTRLDLEKMKSSEFEMENLKIKSEIENLKTKLKETTNGVRDSDDQKIDQLELERKQFESLLQSFQDENEQLRNKLKKSDDLVAILNIERDCLMKKLNEQLKLTKK